MAAIYERDLQAASRPGLELQRQLETAHPRLKAHPDLVASAIQVWIESEQPLEAERERERPKVLADE